MDKPGSEKTITIKINGKNRPPYESKKSGPSKNIPLMETSKHEDLETLTKREMAAGQELKDDEEFDWILPELQEEEEDDITEYKIAPTKKGKKSNRVYQVFTPPKKNNAYKRIIPSILLTVFLAVLLGSSLGILLLKMVISDRAVEVGNTPIVEEKPADVEENTPGTLSVDLPALSSFVIQGGVFSTMEAAFTEAEAMAGRGVPAKAVEMDGKFLLFIGIADNLANAKALGTLLNDSGIETFAKEIVVGGGNLGGLHEDEEKLLTQGLLLHETVASLVTAASLSQSQPAELIDSFNTQHGQWNQLENPQKEEIQQLKLEMDKAAENMKSYRENNDAGLLKTIQQHLLNFLAIYNTL